MLGMLPGDTLWVKLACDELKERQLAPFLGRFISASKPP